MNSEIEALLWSARERVTRGSEVIAHGHGGSSEAGVERDQARNEMHLAGLLLQAEAVGTAAKQAEETLRLHRAAALPLVESEKLLTEIAASDAEPWAATEVLDWRSRARNLLAGR